jgi:nucleotide-binding universal stress UspA family protein
MIKNILVPVDFTQISTNAIEYVKHLAKKMNSKVVLLHTNKLVIVTNEVMDTIYTGLDDNDEDVHLKLDVLLREFKYIGLVATKKVGLGVLADDVKDAVAEFDIDLIVTGTSGAKGVDAFFFQTTSVTIFKEVTCPVLIIPANAIFKTIHKMMYATDFLEADIQELEYVCDVAAVFDAEVIVSHIYSNSDELNKNKLALDLLAITMARTIEYKNISYKLFYNENVHDGLEQNIETLDIDILCMAKSEKNFFQNVFSKSNTKVMAYHTRVPLLVLHA